MKTYLENKLIFKNWHEYMLLQYYIWDLIKKVWSIECDKSAKIPVINVNTQQNKKEFRLSI